MAQRAGTAQQVKGSSRIPQRDLTDARVGWGNAGFTDGLQTTGADVMWVASGAVLLRSRSGCGQPLLMVCSGWQWCHLPLACHQWECLISL